MHDTFWRKIPVGGLGSPWALRGELPRARGFTYGSCKRVMDVVFAGLGLVLGVPLLALCAMAICAESRGPVLYRQARILREGKTFTLYKLRTMRLRAGHVGEELYTQDKDARVTAVGRWLRKLRIDELPQLWNVLRGDMSLIGPRAEWDRCVEIYEQEIPGYHLRHVVKPGITGWAQVNYPYGQSVADTVEKLKYDLYYIENYSLLLDATIVLKTLYVILSLKGK